MWARRRAATSCRARPLDRRRPLPPALRVARRGDRGATWSSEGVPTARDRLLGGGVLDPERRAVAGDPLAADQQAGIAAPRDRRVDTRSSDCRNRSRNLSVMSDEWQRRGGPRRRAARPQAGRAAAAASTWTMRRESGWATGVIVTRDGSRMFMYAQTEETGARGRAGAPAELGRTTRGCPEPKFRAHSLASGCRRVEGRRRRRGPRPRQQRVTEHERPRDRTPRPRRRSRSGSTSGRCASTCRAAHDTRETRRPARRRGHRRARDHWKYLLDRRRSEERANELAERISAEAPEGSVDPGRHGAGAPHPVFVFLGAAHARASGATSGL